MPAAPGLETAPSQSPAIAVNPAALAAGLGALLKSIGPYICMGFLVLYVRQASPAPAPAAPDRVAVALGHWHQGQSAAYGAVKIKLRTGQITRLDQVQPALKEAFLPTAKEVSDSLTGALQVLTDSQGNFTNQSAAADVLERAENASK